jgi:hypothetical protein
MKLNIIIAVDIVLAEIYASVLAIQNNIIQENVIAVSIN